MLKKMKESEEPNEQYLLLNFACKAGNVAIVRSLIEEKNLDVNRTDFMGQTALHHLCKQNKMNKQEEIAKVLIDNSANLFLKDNDGKLAIDYFLKDRNKEFYDFLLLSMYIYKCKFKHKNVFFQNCCKLGFSHY
jgi:ankyrin repeat protein